MDAPSGRPWLRAALLVGAAYFVIGRSFAAPTDHVQAWRLAAWAASGVAFAAHIAYEHFRLRSARRALASRAALAVAIGAAALAVAGMLHAVSVGSGIGPSWILALVAWPAITAVPAFCAAFVAGTVLTRLGR